MTELDTAAVKARADAATPGPWELDHGWTFDDRRYFRRLMDPAQISVVSAVVAGEDLRATTADAEFIAHARTDVPALLARIAELEADVSDAHHEGFGVGMESADRDIDQIAAAAERRGYERAVARLRDGDAYAAWHGPFEFAQPNWRLHFADYLDAVKEGR